jgi:molybdenum cofactor guanylyltransferase
MASKLSGLSTIGIILAGGKSTRMGEDKGTIVLGGVPLIRRVYAAISPVVGEVYVVGTGVSRYAPLLPSDCRFLEEEPMYRGPLWGLAAAWESLPPCDWILVTACDLPNLQTRVLQQWHDRLPSLSPTELAYLPRSSRGWEPLCGFYRDRQRASLTAAVAAGTNSFQDWLAGMTIATIDRVPPQMAFNCNTPADIELFQQSRVDGSST